MDTHRPELPPGIRRRRLGRLSALLVVAGLVGSCGSCDDDDEYDTAATCWCVPRVETVRIVPERFQVKPGSRVELRARLYDDDGNEIPEFYAYRPQWQATPAGKVTLQRRDGHVVLLEIPDDMAGPFTVTVEAVPGVSKTAAGTVVVGTPANDHVVGVDHVTGEPLAIALAADDASPTWAVNPVAFAGKGDIGNLQTSTVATGGVMVFSSDKEMAYNPVSWDATRNIVDHTSETGVNVVQRALRSPFVIDVTLWIDPVALPDPWTATTAEAVALIHIGDATRTFLRNRTGVQFSVRAAYTLTSTIPDDDCSWSTTLQGVSTRDGSIGTYNPSTNTNAIDVFLMDRGIETGFSCMETTPDITPGFRIFLNAKYPIPTVQGHELGHVLGAPHVTGQPSNLMYSGDDDDYDSDDAPTPRRAHLTIGQACLMNQSVVIRALRGNPAKYPTPSVCPALTLDIP